jgi:hypothetical protein
LALEQELPQLVPAQVLVLLPEQERARELGPLRQPFRCWLQESRLLSLLEQEERRYRHLRRRVRQQLAHRQSVQAQCQRVVPKYLQAAQLLRLSAQLLLAQEWSQLRRRGLQGFRQRHRKPDPAT